MFVSFWASFCTKLFEDFAQVISPGPPLVFFLAGSKQGHAPFNIHFLWPIFCGTQLS